jgi:PPP family 3-phenylpropionic acid transporter
VLDTDSAVAFPTIIAVAMMASALVARRLPKGLSYPPARIPGAARALFESLDFRLFLLTGFFWLASHAAYDMCISLHLRDLGGSGTAIGISWAMGTAFEIVLMAFGGWLLSRFPAPRLLTAGLIGMMLRWILLSLVPWLVVIICTQFLHALSFAVVWIAALEHIRRRAPPAVLATAQGAFAGVSALGSGLSMLAWGQLYETLRGTGVFAAAAIVALLAVITSFLCARCLPRRFVVT